MSPLSNGRNLFGNFCTGLDMIIQLDIIDQTT